MVAKRQGRQGEGPLFMHPGTMLKFPKWLSDRQGANPVQRAASSLRGLARTGKTTQNVPAILGQGHRR